MCSCICQFVQWRKKKKLYIQNALSIITTFEQASKSQAWKDAIKSKITTTEKNGTWELTDLPTVAKKTGVKMVFKTKLNEKWEVDKCKARLIAKGYT